MNEMYETKYFCNSAEVSNLCNTCSYWFNHCLTNVNELEALLLCLIQEWQAAGVEQLRLSTVDLTGVPTLENLHRGVDFALKHREQGNSVYVHCKAGRSRSATLVAAYLIKVRLKTCKATFKHLRSTQGLFLNRNFLLTLFVHCCKLFGTKKAKLFILNPNQGFKIRDHLQSLIIGCRKLLP